MATPARSQESPLAADLAPVAGAAEDAECPPPRQPQPPQNVLAAPRLRAPNSRGLGAAEFGGATGNVEAPGETFAQRVSLGPAKSPPGSSGSAPWDAPLPAPIPISFLEGHLVLDLFQARGLVAGLQPQSHRVQPGARRLCFWLPGVLAPHQLLVDFIYSVPVSALQGEGLYPKSFRCLSPK